MSFLGFYDGRGDGRYDGVGSGIAGEGNGRFGSGGHNFCSLCAKIEWSITQKSDDLPP